MNNKERFLSGQPFFGKRMLFVKFRFNGEYIEQQPYGPFEDRWCFYCAADTSGEESFMANMSLLGETTIQSEFHYNTLQFIDSSKYQRNPPAHADG